MRGFSWLHLVLAVLIIIFAVIGNVTLIIILAAVIAILSLFGVCSCGTKRSYYDKKEMKPAPRKHKKR
ncbi:hypothetical protein J4406_00335 [Candidatus Woesearchaeota archaeon]|nr:hypothetical protein [Candidatus Woesearchaeota archaeon]